MSNNNIQNSNEACDVKDRTRCKCAWPWISGFFAAPAFVHLVRLLSGWQVTIGDYQVPMWVSWICVFGCGAIAIIAAILGCKKS